MQNIINIKSGHHHQIETQSIEVNRLAIYGADIHVILSNIINNSCELSFNLNDEYKKELMQINMSTLIIHKESYHKWNLCIFELNNPIIFPQISWAGDDVNNIDISFKCSNKNLSIGLFTNKNNYLN